MRSDLFLNVRWPLFQGSVQQLFSNCGWKWSVCGQAFMAEVKLLNGVINTLVNCWHTIWWQFLIVCVLVERQRQWDTWVRILGHPINGQILMVSAFVGGASFGHHACWGLRCDHEVHAWARAHPSEERGAHSGGYQAVLHQRRTRGDDTHPYTKLCHMNPFFTKSTMPKSADLSFLRFSPTGHASMVHLKEGRVKAAASEMRTGGTSFLMSHVLRLQILRYTSIRS